IYGLGSGDAGETVRVRIGPLGPYAHGFAGSWHVFAFSPIVVIMFGVLLAGRRKAVRRAASLLDGPASHGDLLIVTGTGARTPDKQHYASVVSVPRPPVPLPAGMKASHWEVRGHTGQPMFRVEKRGGKKVVPEFALLDPSGAPRVIVRNAGTSPASYAILYPDGTPAGRIDPPKHTGSGAYEFTDTQGRVWARTAPRIPEWVLRMEPGAPPPFPYLAMAFTIGQRRPVR
ncbi:hypothetical protein ACFQ07_27580, partial [Actinomadura adrarensis]